MKTLRIYILLYSLLTLSNSVLGQIVITPNVGTTGIINSVSATGFVVSNVTIHCNSNAYGTFNGGTSAGFGLNSGLLLSTGLTSEIGSTGTNQNDDFDHSFGTTSTDPQITSVIGTGVSIFDPCIVEFDIIPQCGTITLTFVFGSDEYTNWVSQGFNDGFGFFVSGPNPAGGSYTNTNIATLPNGTLVSIDNVNTTTNSSYFTNNNNGSSNNHLDGFTKLITSIVTVVPCQTYHFKLVIADAGDGQVDSAVLLDFIQCSNPLTITTSSTPDHCSTSNGTATVVTSGGTGPFTYSWAPNGGTNATATGLAAGTYTVTVNDALSCSPALTSTVVVPVDGIAPGVTIPSDITVCNGESVSASNFVSTPSGATFAWTNSNASIGLASIGTGDQPAFTAMNTSTIAQVATITVTPTITGQCPGIPKTYTITVLPTPVMNPVSDISVCGGIAIPQTVFASSVASTLFNWTNSNTAIGLSTSGTGNQPSFTGTNSTSAPVVGTISVIPNVNNLCFGLPVTYTITIKPIPSISVISNTTVCVDDQIPTSNFVVTPNTAAIDWTNSNTSIGLPASGTGNYAGFTSLNPTPNTIVSTIMVTPSLNGCSGFPASYTITVVQRPQAVDPADVSLCVGGIIPLSEFESGATTGVTYSWTNSNSTIGLPVSGTGSVPSFTAINNGITSQVAHIIITPTVGSCLGDTVGYQITVLPQPSMSALTAITVCQGDTVAPPFFSSVPTGSTFSWTNSNSSIGLLASGSGNIASFSAINTANTIQTATITVAPTLNGCQGNPVNFTINVKPKPTIQPVSNITACANVSINSVAFTSDPVGAQFGWVNSNSTIGLSGVGVGNLPVFVGLNSNSTSNQGTIQVIPTLSNCVGLPISFMITINPIPLVVASNNGPICEGNNLNLSVNTTSGATYSWTDGNGYQSSVQNPVINAAAPTQSGIYTVQVTANNCTNFDTTTVLINPILLATINSVGPFCQNDSPVTMAASYSPGVWSGNVITADGIFDPSIAPVGSTTITYTTVGNCPSATTSTVVVNQVPVVEFYVDTNTGCVPLTIHFTNITSPISESVIWHFGDSTTSTDVQEVSHTYTTVGCFDVTLESTTNGCSNSLTQVDMICSLPRAVASFIALPDSVTIFSPIFHFENTSIDVTSYTWDFGDSSTSVLTDPAHTYPAIPSNYTVTLIAHNDVGCPDTAYLEIRVKDVLIYFVPNAFTPDHDNFNPTFQPVFTSGFVPESYQFFIYNRWGELIFETNDFQAGWDGLFKGEKVQEDVYTWKINFKESETPIHRSITGHVSLLR